ncbi:hypothetical protein GETHOR_23560 [Geothrix oryzae]|uniref:Uncharacterized protein n=1 Tax=Geothrix oryzae TaxID=2927975 RepID=A0ABM8DTF2_9BACT|nr:hypothetical protein GETHOR_23560 [Geothrix oryzae]
MKDPKFRAKIRAAEVLLCGESGDASQARTQIYNLALSYQQALAVDAEGGTWKQSADQLDALAANASQMAGQFKYLKEGARRLLLMEACPEQEDLRGMADINGLEPEFQFGQFLGAPLDGNVRWEDEGPGIPTLDPSGIPSLDPRPRAVRESRPRWISRMEALAAVCRDGAKIAQERAAKRGKRTALGDTYGSPELQLLRECADQLVKLGRDDTKAFALAKVVRQLVTRVAPSQDWATEAKRQFTPWWTRVREWSGREMEAPEDIQCLLKCGPQALPKRRSKSRKSV